MVDPFQMLIIFVLSASLLLNDLTLLSHYAHIAKKDLFISADFIFLNFRSRPQIFR